MALTHPCTFLSGEVAVGELVNKFVRGFIKGGSSSLEVRDTGW